MRQLVLIFAVLGLLAGSFAHNAKAADDNAIYTVTDVQTDVSADNAVKARDQAIAQAQRAAFAQLVQRLGASDSVAQKLSDDDIASLVKSFQVANERRSAVRYIGSFTVQFRPVAVRRYLDGHNATYNETRGGAVVVLPVLMTELKSVLWEDKTKWHTAWENSAAAKGLVPVIVPSGGLDDIAAISTSEAIAGRNLKSIIDKYQGHGAAVVILSGDIDKGTTPFKVDLSHYDANGDLLSSVKIEVPVAGRTTIDSSLAQAVQQSRQQLEKDWQKEEKTTKDGKMQVEVTDDAGGDSSPSVRGLAPPTIPREAAANHLPAIVAINSLPEWAHIENKLASIPQVSRVEVVSLQRGETRIEIEYTGSLQGLRSALADQYLTLQQDRMTRNWVIRQSIAEPRMYQ